MNVLHIAVIPSEGKPRYRVKPMMFVPHSGRTKQATPPFEMLMAEGMRLAAREGIERVREILATFCAAKISEVPLAGRGELLSAFRSALASVPAAGLSRMDRFAEHLARGSTIAEASAAIGVSAPYGNSIMQRIRKRLGPQAI